MQLPTYSWETALLSLAHEARHVDMGPNALQFAPQLLHQAYAYCDKVTALHSRSFYLASGLLPAEKRRATRALYAFCRVTDDLVDRATGDEWSQLAAWRRRVLTTNPALDDLIAVAWTDARLRYGVPVRYAEQLIDGVAKDLARVRYQTFEELTAYCYCVASTVGLMSMHIVGYAGSHAVPYAIKLGVALQITNILRDIAEDWRTDRIYLPQADLVHFGLSETDLTAGRVTDQWRAFMCFQIERNRCLYQEAMPGIQLLDPDGRFAIAAAAELYCAILTDIEAHDYDVFTRRAHVGTWGKLRRLPGIWWRSGKQYMIDSRR